MPRPSLILTRSIALIVLLVLCPSVAIADCQAWQLLRKFNAVQTNGYTVVFELGEVASGKVKGSAHYYAGSDFRRYEGRAEGIFDGKHLTLSVWWPHNKSFGEYKGHIDGGGSLAGITKDLQNPSGTNPEVFWRSKQTFKCGNPFCDDYAAKAVAAVAANAKQKCGYTGPRWSPDANLHRVWCVANQAMANSETAARASALDDCKRAALRR